MEFYSAFFDLTGGDFIRSFNTAYKKREKGCQFLSEEGL